jgi:4'-phosphopantetheinyl transferase
LGSLTLAENQIDIWRIHLAGHNGGVQHCRLLLSPDEIQRADRFYLETHRRRFTASRSAMRQILGCYGGLAPEKLTFSYGPRGKPELSGKLEQSGIRFNLSHSNDVALLAVAQGLTLGVDIEFINSEFAVEEVAERFFSPSEVRRLQAVPPCEKPDAFFACWTRKEAYIKALGGGLSVPLDSFEVAFGSGIPTALLQVSDDPGELMRWSLYDIDAVEGYRAALAVEGKGHQLRYGRTSGSAGSEIGAK